MDNAQSTEANATSRVADAPFNDLSGDIILRASDADMVDFRTHKVFLIHASSFFETMLSLPQSQGAPTQESTIPIVEMHENPEDLRSILLFCHPGTVHEPPTSLIRLNQLSRFIHGKGASWSILLGETFRVERRSAVGGKEMPLIPPFRVEGLVRSYFARDIARVPPDLVPGSGSGIGHPFFPVSNSRQRRAAVLESHGTQTNGCI